MTTTQYNSSKNTPVSHLSLNEASFEKRHNLDEHVNIVSKAEELSVTQISFKTQDPNIRHNPESVSKVTADPRSTVFWKSVNLFDLPHISTIRVTFKAKSIDPKTYSPASKGEPLLALIKNSELKI